MWRRRNHRDRKKERRQEREMVVCKQCELEERGGEIVNLLILEHHRQFQSMSSHRLIASAESDLLTIPDTNLTTLAG